MARNGDPVYTQFYAPHLRGTGRKNNPRNNDQTMGELSYIRIFTELCTNRFKWVGMPDSVDERYLEMKLFAGAGGIVFYWDHDYDKYLVQPIAEVGNVNHYDNPTWFNIASNGGVRPKQLSAKDCVPIWANYLRTPDIDIVLRYARRLAALDTSLDITALNMRHPKIAVTDPNNKQSMVNILRQIDEGQSSIGVVNNVAGGGMGSIADNISVLDMGVPTGTLNELRTERTAQWNECMGLLGINNQGVSEKRERVQSAEVDANDEQVNATRNVAMNSRMQAASQINAMYEGLNINVVFNPDVTNYALDFAEGLRI